MTDEQFRQLCNTFGFAPSRALREMIDCVRAQEIEACANVCDEYSKANMESDLMCAAFDHCAVAIRARKEKT